MGRLIPLRSRRVQNPDERIDYLAHLSDPPQFELAGCRGKERELFNQMGAWRKLVLMEPSPHGFDQLRAATRAWLLQVDRLEYREAQR